MSNTDFAGLLALFTVVGLLSFALGYMAGYISGDEDDG